MNFPRQLAARVASAIESDPKKHPEMVAALTRELSESELGKLADRAAAELASVRASRTRASSSEYPSLERLSRALFPHSENDRMAFVAKVLRERAARAGK